MKRWLSKWWPFHIHAWGSWEIGTAQQQFIWESEWSEIQVQGRKCETCGLTEARRLSI